MTITPVYRGAAPDDGTGDSFYDAAGKLNANDAGLAGGANVFDQTLREWVEGGAYEATAISFDADGVVTTATVKWPDGSAGTYTTVTKNTDFLTVDSYTISHTDSGKTVTQSAVTTRDATTGDVTAKPALTVS